MEDLIIKETIDMPAVEFYASIGLFSIKGRSVSNDPSSFYSLLFDYIDEYKKAPQPHTKVDLKIEYFNTTSSKYILEVLKKIKGIISKKNTLEVNWLYDEDDEEMFEVGEDFMVLTKLSFNFKSVAV